MKPLPYILLIALCGCVAPRQKVVTVPDLDPTHAPMARIVESETIQGASTIVVEQPQFHTFKVSYEPNDPNNMGDECVIDIYQSADLKVWMLWGTIPCDSTNFVVITSEPQMFFQAQARSLTTGLTSK